jgi:hypothetical protein
MSTGRCYHSIQISTTLYTLLENLRRIATWIWRSWIEWLFFFTSELVDDDPDERANALVRSLSIAILHHRG